MKHGRRVALTGVLVVSAAASMALTTRHAALAQEAVAAAPAENPAPAEKAAPAENSALFEKEVGPLLEKRCGMCHGEDKREGGLDVRRRSRLLQGGDSGAAIVPGKAEESLLLARITSDEMPPDKPLDPAERDLIRRWLLAGAPAATPEAPLADGEAASRVTSEDRSFWAFRTPQRPALPVVRGTDQVRTPMDSFLLESLEAKQLQFGADAAPATLVRRLYFDLTGLPPTPEQLDDWLADTRPDAWERLVDQLLASPHYGERWGRHWLDIAGYADSDGYLAADRLRPEAWRYRDYVIRSLNSDLPYDQFVREQLAGDELTDWRRADELTPAVLSQLEATGFLRTASDPTYPGYTEPNEIHQVISDTMQIFGSTFLGLTVHCARCHSHKFDPLSHREYYQLVAVFTPALDPARWQPSEVRGITAATESDAKWITERNRRADERITQLKAELQELLLRFRKRLREQIAEVKPPVPSEVRDSLIDALLVATDKRNDPQKALVAQHAPQVASVSETEVINGYPECQQESNRLQAAIASESAIKRPLLKLRGLMDLDDKPAATHVLRRGDHSKPGGEVLPGIPEVLAPASYQFQSVAAYQTSGRRAALARWLTDPSHPLLWRVHANRLWAHHFGRGIVPTMANFGHSGAPPTHPRLLDWLATELVAQGGSQKALHRQMLTSTAFRQTADRAPAQIQADPDNLLLGAWRPRRHEGEILRDASLFVADRLNLPLFGAPSPVAPQGDGSVITSDDAAGNRRSIYLIVRRSQHLTLFDLFDTPVMEVNCPQRSTSTVPLQALAMLHGPFAEQTARALAERLWRDAPGTDDERIDLAYRRLYSRLPTPSERAAIHQFLASASAESGTGSSAAEPQAALRAAWNQAALVLLNSNEFMYVP